MLASKVLQETLELHQLCGLGACETVIPWYCGAVANITVTVPDDVYRAARIKAAEQGSSVSALVAGYLRSLSAADDEFRRLERQQDEVFARLGSFSGADRLDRDDVHGRAVR